VCSLGGGEGVGAFLGGGLSSRVLLRGSIVGF